MSAAIECLNLEAGYGRIKVVRDFSLTLQEASVAALLGPNGAGKTTVLLTLSGILPALGGTVTILGEPVSSAAPHKVAARGFAHVPEDRSLFTELTVRENLSLSARPGRVSPADVLEYFPSLRKRYKVKAGTLSGGEQQMLAIARALVTNPKVLVIDEMSTGLAPVIVHELLEILKRVVRDLGASVLLVEQHVRLALEVASSVTVLNHGRTVYSGPAEPLMSNESLLEQAYLSGTAD